MKARAVVVCSLCLLLCASTAAQEPEPIPEPPPPDAEGALPAWAERILEGATLLEEGGAREPPLLELEAGFLAFVELRSTLQADANGRSGTRLEDLEANQGLDSAGFSPWLELTLGGRVRFGLDTLYLARGGRLQQQDEAVVFDGVEVAGPGEFVESELEFFTLGAFVQWDWLLGPEYRVAAIGGARYFRLDSTLTGIRGDVVQPRLKTRVRGELASPYFGALLELRPYPTISFTTQVQLINWSWETIQLEEAAYYDFRLGTTIYFIPGTFGVSVEYRLLAVTAEPQLSGADRIEGRLLASGFMVAATLAF